MRIVTWNVNSLKARLPRVLELLADLRPDALCLQETKVAAEAFPHAELAAAGYGAVHSSSGRWCGVAILAPLDRTLSDASPELPGEPPAEGEARWIEATLDGIRIVSTYVPNGREPDSPWFEQKLAFLDAAVARAGVLSGAPLVVCGDLNVAPGDLDAYDPSLFLTHVTEDERSRFRGLLASGLVDAYRELEPETVRYTWWDYRAGHFHKNLGLRIDHVLVSRDLAGGLVSCDIARDYRKGLKPSDHAPLVCDLR